jgi:hypothetical protein
MLTHNHTGFRAGLHEISLFSIHYHYTDVSHAILLAMS